MLKNLTLSSYCTITFFIYFTERELQFYVRTTLFLSVIFLNYSNHFY
nr:MAG TPA: hypothetical protein [Caudoviricetes sp.]